MPKKKRPRRARKMTHWVLLGFSVGIFWLTFVLTWYHTLEQTKEVARVQEQERAQVAIPSYLKLAFVNDWEYGSRLRLKHKLTSRSPLELEKVVAYLNDEFEPDLVIGGGDYVEGSGVKKETAKTQLATINHVFQKLEAPRLYALGNHDLRALTKEEVRGILEIEDNHAVRDVGDWRVIVLDTNFNKENDTHRGEKTYVTGYVSREELEWLRSVLETERPVIVFSHHSPLSTPRANGLSWVINITNEAEVREALEKHGNVVAVVSGHNPQSYYEERNGIHYFIVDTLVNESALGSFATLEMKYTYPTKQAEVVFEQKGMRPAQHQVEWLWGAKNSSTVPPVRAIELIEEE